MGTGQFRSHASIRFQYDMGAPQSVPRFAASLLGNWSLAAVATIQSGMLLPSPGQIPLMFLESAKIGHN